MDDVTVCIPCDEAVCEVIECKPTLWQRTKNTFHKYFPKKYNPEESSLYFHAKTELTAAGYFKDDTDGMNKEMANNVLALIATLGEQGHSGFSARFCIELFATLASYQPLLPLQGTEEEWHDVSEYGCSEDDGFMKQNIRCSHVFMNKHGAYDIDAIVYREPDGSTYTKGGARNYITFPYTPTVTYVDVPYHDDDPRSKLEPQLTLAFGT